MNVEFLEHPVVGDMFAVHRDGPAIEAEVVFVRPEAVTRVPKVIAYKRVEKECDALVLATEI